MVRLMGLSSLHTLKHNLRLPQVDHPLKSRPVIISSVPLRRQAQREFLGRGAPESSEKDRETLTGGNIKRQVRRVTVQAQIEPVRMNGGPAVAIPKQDMYPSESGISERTQRSG